MVTEHKACSNAVWMDFSPQRKIFPPKNNNNDNKTVNMDFRLHLFYCPRLKYPAWQDARRLFSFLHGQKDFSSCEGGGKWWSSRAIQLLRSGDINITFIFIAEKNKSVMIKCNCMQHRNTANTTPALCEHLHRQHANTELTKKPVWC